MTQRAHKATNNTQVALPTGGFFIGKRCRSNTASKTITKRNPHDGHHGADTDILRAFSSMPKHCLANRAACHSTKRRSPKRTGKGTKKIATASPTSEMATTSASFVVAVLRRRAGQNSSPPRHQRDAPLIDPQHHPVGE